MKRPHLALLASFIVLSACSILPKSEPSDVYRLPSAQSSAPVSHGTPQRWSLRLTKPQASEALNSPKIAVIPQGDQGVERSQSITERSHVAKVRRLDTVLTGAHQF